MIVIDLLGETEDGLVHSQKDSCENDPERKKGRPEDLIPETALQIVVPTTPANEVPPPILPD